MTGLESPARPVNGERRLSRRISTAGTMPGMHPSAENVARVLRDHDVAGEVRELAEPAPTAATAAAQVGCDVGAIANSLVFDADGEPLLILTSGAHRVDTAKAAAIAGAKAVRRADPDFVRAATGQVIGGVAPVGHPKPIRTLVDTWLEKYDVVWAAGGHVHTVFPTTFAELVRITEGTPADVG
jgi:prolyl-tRNA editing enzyme YbaK/EbsC (Cys-tRNA(Pro) deacylase)